MSENTRPAEPAALHPCPGCGSGLVDLVDAVEVHPGRWDLTLRCADCEGPHAVSCDEGGLARVEHALCDATAELERALEQFARLRFEEDIARFVAALEAGAILPMDFGCPR